MCVTTYNHSNYTFDNIIIPNGGVADQDLLIFQDEFPELPLPDQFPLPNDEEEFLDPLDPDTAWISIEVAKALSGIQDPLEILRAIHWRRFDEEDRFYPCVNCLHYGWERDDPNDPRVQPAGNGAGRCLNCFDKPQDPNVQEKIDAWLELQARTETEAQAVAEAVALAAEVAEVADMILA